MNQDFEGINERATLPDLQWPNFKYTAQRWPIMTVIERSCAISSYKTRIPRPS